MPLSTKQMEYLALAWQSFENEPKINYDHFAKVAGLASPHSARELMRVTKKKLKEEYGYLSGEMQAFNAATTYKAKGRGRPAAAAAATASSPAPTSATADDAGATAAVTPGGGKKQASVTPKTPSTTGRKRGRPAKNSGQADSPLANSVKSKGNGNGKGKGKASTDNNSTDQNTDHGDEDDGDSEASPVSNKRIKTEPNTITTVTEYEGGDEMVGPLELFQ